MQIEIQPWPSSITARMKDGSRALPRMSCHRLPQVSHGCCTRSWRLACSCKASIARRRAPAISITDRNPHGLPRRFLIGSDAYRHGHQAQHRSCRYGSMVRGAHRACGITRQAAARPPGWVSRSIMWHIIVPALLPHYWSLTNQVATRVAKNGEYARGAPPNGTYSIQLDDFAADRSPVMTNRFRVPTFALGSAIDRSP